MKARLGIYIPMYGGWLARAPLEEQVTYSNAQNAAVIAESIGIHSVWVPDHLLNPIKGQNAPSLEAWTTLAGIAAATEKIELFHTTLCQGFRHPSVLAKMCVTMQDLSRGRFRLSLGAGWYFREFEAYGLPWEDHDSRIEKSREQIEIIKSLWKEPLVNYSGRYYSIKDCILEPKPSHEISLWWGGESYGSRELAATFFDGWLMDRSTNVDVIRKIDDMKRRLAKQKRGSIKYAVPGLLLIEKDDSVAEERLRNLLPENRTLIETLKSTGYVGSPETVSSKIQERDDTGVDYIIFQCAPTVQTLRNLEEEVLPSL